jgi:hypothetical protein
MLTYLLEYNINKIYKNIRGCKTGFGMYNNLE